MAGRQPAPSDRNIKEAPVEKGIDMSRSPELLVSGAAEANLLLHAEMQGRGSVYVNGVSTCSSAGTQDVAPTNRGLPRLVSRPAVPHIPLERDKPLSKE